jgi:hypothetical protein
LKSESSGFVNDAFTGLATSTACRSPSAAFCSATDAASSGERHRRRRDLGFPPRSSTVTSGMSQFFVRTSVVEATSRACAPAWSGGIGWSDGARAGSPFPAEVDAAPTL